MRDPFAWSIPLGRLFGITIRVHLLFPVVALGLILRAAYREGAIPGQWIDYAVVMAVLFFSVLLHEFGHCFAARFMQGDATEILLWPLGGLANCEVPHTPRANFVVAAAGPAVNVVLGLFSVLLLFLIEPSLQPPWDPRYCLGRGLDGLIPLHLWNGTSQSFAPFSPQVLLSHLFWTNWFLSLINVVLVGFPFDAGRMLQSVLWNYFGYRQATIWAVIVGFVVMFIVGVYSILANEVLRPGSVCVHLRRVPASVDRAGNRRRGIAVRLRFLAGLHQSGARSARPRSRRRNRVGGSAGGRSAPPRSSSARSNAAKLKNAAWISCSKKSRRKA